MDMVDALGAYRVPFDEGPTIFGLGISDEKLLELFKLPLESGSPLTEKELADGAGVK